MNTPRNMIPTLRALARWGFEPGSSGPQPSMLTAMLCHFQGNIRHARLILAYIGPKTSNCKISLGGKICNEVKVPIQILFSNFFLLSM